MKKRKSINFIEQYKKGFKYLGESKNFIYGVISAFVIFTLIGFFAPMPVQIEEIIINFIEEIIEKTKDMSQTELINFIFLNNLQSSFLGMMLGLILGIFSVITAIVNGYLLGFVASVAVKAEGVLSLWRILPHGIFELTAVFISLGLGLKLGTFIFHKKKIKTLKKYLKESLRIFFLIVVPLLILAAIIEGILIFLI